MSELQAGGAVAEERPQAQGISGDVRDRPLGRAFAPGLRRAASVLTLVAIDLSALVLGLLFAFLIKQAVRGPRVDLAVVWTAERQVLPLVGLTLVLVFARLGLYAHREHRAGSAAVLAGVSAATAMMLVFALVADYEFNTYYIFYSSWLFTTVLVIALRASYESLTALALERAHYRRRALIVGEPALAGPIATSLTARRAGHGVMWEVVGVHQPAADLMRDQPSRSGQALRDAINPDTIDEVIVAGGLAATDGLQDLLLLCRRANIPVRLAPTPHELVTYTIRPSAAVGLPLLELRPPTLGWVQFRLKRAFDIVVGVLLVIVTAPLVAMAAIAVKLQDRGPAFYRARRIGLNQRSFDCLKLRTMRTDAEVLHAQLENANEASGPLFKIRDDPRVTPVGRILRRLSIDELPQLVNVLRGEMSLVGPRPLPERDFALMDEDQKNRYVVMPGLTGLWQVSGRADLSADDLLRLDMQYIQEWSIWSDIVILLRTVPAVLGREGAY